MSQPVYFWKNKGFRYQFLVLGVGFLLLLVKFFTYYLTSSNAILSDALESIINVLAGSFALYSLYLSAKPKDTDHPYGHGKIEFIAAGVEGTMVLLAGVFIIYKSVKGLLLQTYEVQHLDIGLAVTFGAGLVNFVMGRFLVQKGSALRSATLIADGKHLQSDAYTSAGLLLGLGVVYISQVIWLDNVIAILLALLIMFMGFKIVRSAVRDIMDEIDFKEAEHVVDTLNEIRQPAWIDVHNLRIIKFGAALHIDCHITIPYYFDINEGHDEIEKLDELMNARIDPNIEFFVHMDPCTPDSCKICSLKDCPVRKFEQEKTVKWELKNVLDNRKHEV